MCIRDSDEPFRRDPCKDDRGKKTEVRKGAGARLPDEESKGAGADTAPMSITEKRISAGSTGTAGTQRAGSGAGTGALDTSAAMEASSAGADAGAGAGTGAGTGVGAAAQRIAKQHSNTGKHKSAVEQHNPPAPHKTRSPRNSASHAQATPHTNISTEHKARSPHVLKKPLLGENYHAYKEK